MRHCPDALMLFAAGRGTRMGDLTADRPKPLIPVAGTALIDHALRLVDAAKIDRVVVNLHYRHEQLRAHLAERRDLTFSHETDLLETGGGLLHALPLLGEGPVATMNSDAVWTGPNPLTALQEAWNGDRMDALLLLVAKDRARGHSGPGDFVMAPDGSLTRGPDLIYTGAQILKTDRLSDIEQPVFSLNVVWDLMLAERRVFGLLHGGYWCDVGRPDSIALAETMLGEVDDV